MEGEDRSLDIFSGIKIALAANELDSVCKLVDVWKTVQSSKPEVAATISADNDVALIMSEVKQRLDDWKSSLKAGDSFDWFDQVSGKWCNVKILNGQGNDLYVHYNGWGGKYDAWVLLEKLTIFPSWSKVHKKAQPKRKAPVPHSEYVVVNPDSECSTEKTELPKAENLESDVSTNKFGRRIKTSASTATATTTSPRSKKAKSATDAGDEVPDHNEWVCAVCDSLEAVDSSDLLLCDGACKRSWHTGCMHMPADMAQQLLSNEAPWLCADCVDHQHHCFICGVRGIDNLEVVNCSVANCGKFYHQKCLESPNKQTGDFLVPKMSLVKKPCLISLAAAQSQSDTGGRKQAKKISAPASSSSSQQDDSDTSMTLVDSFSFKCPLHLCYTCYHMHGAGGGPVFDCLRCPRAFHVNCILPGSRFNSMCLLCPLHTTVALPSRGSLTSKMSISVMDSLWEQMGLPEELPNVNDSGANHFKLPLSFTQDSTIEPAAFKMIQKLDYETFPGKEKALAVEQPDDICICEHGCGSNCLNRILKIECCDSGSSKKSTNTICNIDHILRLKGDAKSCTECGNRMFQNKQYAKTEKFREHAMGWGLRSLEAVSAGALVLEYIGEVIDTTEMRRRMTDQRTNSPADHDFYIMELDNNVYVDGKHKGNHSRFINHSCEPNCELERWLVKGKMRIGIFALKDIPTNEPLSYDYQFDTNEESLFRCYCGTATCRGTMAPGKNKKSKKAMRDKSVDSLGKEDRSWLLALGKSLQNKSSAQRAAEEWGRSLTGKYLPGDAVAEVKNGPLKSCFEPARDGHLFLCRNARSCVDFVARRQSFRHKKIRRRTCALFKVNDK